MPGRQDSWGLTADSNVQLHARPLQLHACQDLIKFILFRPLEAPSHWLLALKPEQGAGSGGLGSGWLFEHFSQCHLSLMASPAARSRDRP